jgi:hypothetical protein
METFANADGTGAGAAITALNRQVTRQPVIVANSTVSTQTFTTFDLYINNIFMNPEVHDIYIKRIGFSLIRVYRTQKTQLTQSNADFLLSQLKWPVEHMYIGFKPTYNITNPVYSGLTVSSGNPNAYRDWHKYNVITDREVYSLAQSGTLLATTNANPSLITPNTAVMQTSLIPSERFVFTTQTRTVDLMKIKAHGIDIYSFFEPSFYNRYLPWNYGGYNVITPSDDGALLVTFDLYPGTYQPSGHFNISRAREFYVEWQSSYISSSAPVELGVVARCLNFLLISDKQLYLSETVELLICLTQSTNHSIIYIDPTFKSCNRLVIFHKCEVESQTKLVGIWRDNLVRGKLKSEMVMLISWIFANAKFVTHGKVSHSEMDVKEHANPYRKVNYGNSSQLAKTIMIVNRSERKCSDRCLTATIGINGYSCLNQSI